MKEINYIKQPTEYLCGQSCVAMLAGVTVEEVISVMQNDKGTGKKDIDILKVFCPNMLIGSYTIMGNTMTRNLA